MIEQEKENNITSKEKTRRRRKEDKENITLSSKEREPKNEKETRIQKVASSRVDRWIRLGSKEEQLRFKTKQMILI